jgi:hypothetical protein
MISLEEYLFGKPILADIPLYGPQQGFVPSGKTGTAEAYHDFTPMVHCSG